MNIVVLAIVLLAAIIIMIVAIMVVTIIIVVAIIWGPPLWPANSGVSADAEPRDEMDEGSRTSTGGRPCNSMRILSCLYTLYYIPGTIYQ